MLTRVDNASCFSLLFYNGPGGSPRNDLCVIGSFEELRECLCAEFESPDPWRLVQQTARMALEAGEEIWITVVQEGTIELKLNARCFVSVSIDDRPYFSLSDRYAIEALFESEDPLGEGHTVSFQVDFKRLQERIGPLRGRPLKPDEEVILFDGTERDGSMTYGYTGDDPESWPIKAPIVASRTPEVPALVDDQTAPVVVGRSGVARFVLFPEGRLSAGMFQAAAAGRLDWIHQHDPIDAETRTHLECEPWLVVSRMQFLSEATFHNKPLTRSQFEAEARLMAPGVRGVQVHVPRVGPGAVLERDGKFFLTTDARAAFIVSEL